MDTVGYPTPVTVSTTTPTTLGPNINYQTIAIQNTGGPIELSLIGVPIEKGVRDQRTLQPFSFQGSFTWGAPIQGFSCLSISSGNPGIVSAQGYLPGDPTVPGGAFAGIVVPAVLTQLTGLIEGGGAISGGTGFTVPSFGGGSYTIAFDTALSSTPDVLITPRDPAAVTFPVVTSVNGAGFTVVFYNVAGNPTITGWSFAVVPVQ